MRRKERTTLMTMCPSDPVNQPSHYKCGGLECIDVIEAKLTKEEFIGYLRGNVDKYLWRYRNKINPKQDLEKAEWYLRRLIDKE